jgi:hypothetical protein
MERGTSHLGHVEALPLPGWIDASRWALRADRSNPLRTGDPELRPIE